jgi:hypothetical protein
MEGETSVHGPANTVHEVQRDFAAILEASTPSRKSKRRAQSADEHSLDRAEFVHLSNDFVTKNLQSIGILLGNSSDQITLSVNGLRR